MKTRFYRIVIYPKDVKVLTGLSLRAAQRMIETVKKAYGKSRLQFLTIDEFCEFMKFDKALVLEAIG